MSVKTPIQVYDEIRQAIVGNTSLKAIEEPGRNGQAVMWISEFPTERLGNLVQKSLVFKLRITTSPEKWRDAVSQIQEVESYLQNMQGYKVLSEGYIREGEEGDHVLLLTFSLFRVILSGRV